MHWTALLAYRRFPPTARVIDDLHCIKCGYNLRGIRVGDRCPECAAQVGDSLFVLAKPLIVGRGLAGIGRGFFGFLGLLVGCLGLNLWLPLVGSMIICAGAVWRTLSAAELRYRGAIEHLPIIGPRTRMTWWMCVADLIASFCLLGVTILAANTTNPSIRAMLPMTFALWTAIATIAAGAAGMLGRAMAEMLGYGWMVMLFRMQQIMVIGCVGLGVLAATSSMWVGSGPIAIQIFSALFMLGLTAMFITTAIVMIQVSNAATQESDTWEEAIDMNAAI
jgi:hypothetical protein